MRKLSKISLSLTLNYPPYLLSNRFLDSLEDWISVGSQGDITTPTEALVHMSNNYIGVNKKSITVFVFLSVFCRNWFFSVLDY